jgi:hypothetical protein
MELVSVQTFLQQVAELENKLIVIDFDGTISNDYSRDIFGNDLTKILTEPYGYTESFIHVFIRENEKHLPKDDPDAAKIIIARYFRQTRGRELDILVHLLRQEAGSVH